MFPPLWTMSKRDLITTSNIASTRIFSSIPLKPRAPVFLDNAFFAIILRASSVKCSLTCQSQKLKLSHNIIPSVPIAIRLPRNKCQDQIFTAD